MGRLTLFTNYNYLKVQICISQFNNLMDDSGYWNAY